MKSSEMTGGMTLYFIKRQLKVTVQNLAQLQQSSLTSLANSISDQSTSVDSVSMNVGRLANPVTKPGIGI